MFLLLCERKQNWLRVVTVVFRTIGIYVITSTFFNVFYVFNHVFCHASYVFLNYGLQWVMLYCMLSTEPSIHMYGKFAFLAKISLVWFEMNEWIKEWIHIEIKTTLHERTNKRINKHINAVQIDGRKAGIYICKKVRIWIIYCIVLLVEKRQCLVPILVPWKTVLRELADYRRKDFWNRAFSVWVKGLKEWQMVRVKTGTCLAYELN